MGYAKHGNHAVILVVPIVPAVHVCRLLLDPIPHYYSGDTTTLSLYIYDLSRGLITQIG